MEMSAIQIMNCIYVLNCLPPDRPVKFCCISSRFNHFQKHFPAGFFLKKRPINKQISTQFLRKQKSLKSGSLHHLPFFVLSPHFVFVHLDAFFSSPPSLTGDDASFFFSCQKVDTQNDREEKGDDFFLSPNHFGLPNQRAKKVCKSKFGCSTSYTHTVLNKTVQYYVVQITIKIVW